jgi:hypothetical protein
LKYATPLYEGDIWSENGLSLLAVLVHFIDKDWEMNTRLAICKGMGTMAHTGDNIRYLTYSGLVSVDLCESIEEVPGNIRMCTPDEGSNMLAAWREMEGAGCVCHRENNCLGSALSYVGVASALKKLKGVCAKFHRSDKVSFDKVYFSCL